MISPDHDSALLSEQSELKGPRPPETELGRDGARAGINYILKEKREEK